MDLPPHLRAIAAARVRLAAESSKFENKLAIHPEIVSNSSTREQKSMPKQAASSTGSSTETRGSNVSSAPVAPSTAPTSRVSSLQLTRKDSFQRPSTPEQVTGGLSDKNAGGRSCREDRRGRHAHGPKNKRHSTWTHKKDIPKGNDGRWDEAAIWLTVSNDVAEHDGYVPVVGNWDSRPVFRANQNAASIMDWMLMSEEAMSSGSSSSPISIKDVQTVACDIAPHYWIPESFGRQPKQTFWQEIIRSAPQPIDATDLETATAWWETYDSIESPLLQAYTAPVVLGVNPDDEDLDARLARENDHGSAGHAKIRIEFERATRDAVETQLKKVRVEKRRLKEKMEQVEMWLQ